MNLLVVTGIFPPDRGGPASYVPRIAVALAARGHGVEVICLSDRLEPSEEEHSFRVQRLRRGMIWPARVLRTAFNIWRAALRNDLLYVNGLGMEAALAALLAGRPAVHKVVGDYAWERAVGRRWFSGTLEAYQASAKSVRLRLLDAVRTIPLQLAERIIVPSEYLRRITESWQLSDEKIHVIRNAVEEAESPATSRDGGRGIGELPLWSGKTLITVCRLVPWKGLAPLIRLLSELPHTRLVIAGGGHLRAELEALARTEGVVARVLFLGDVPHPEVRRLLAQADAFVLNSTYEGLPHAVLEAMAAGVPVIASDAGGTHEVVEDQVTGLLVPVGDAAALRAAIERLWQEPSLGANLVAEAARRLHAEFDFERMVDATETLLQRATAPSSTAETLVLKETR